MQQGWNRRPEALLASSLPSGGLPALAGRTLRRGGSAAALWWIAARRCIQNLDAVKDCRPGASMVPSTPEKDENEATLHVNVPILLSMAKRAGMCRHSTVQHSRSRFFSARGRVAAGHATTSELEYNLYYGQCMFKSCAWPELLIDTYCLRYVRSGEWAGQALQGRVPVPVQALTGAQTASGKTGKDEDGQSERQLLSDQTV